MAIHYLHLLRHGQYAADPGRGDGPLTALGRRQAGLAGRHLRTLPIRRLWTSDLERAAQTARIVAESLAIDGVTETAQLREVVPTAVPGQRVPLAKRKASRDAVERALTEFFDPARATCHDVLVCHGNLIRALVCAVLGAPSTAWLRLATHHCALTTVAVLPSGERRLVRYGESAYLGASLLTG